jgi:hypothetical protein
VQIRASLQLGALIMPSSALGTAGTGILARWHVLIKVLAISVPIAGAIPTGMNLYYSFKHGIPYSQVSHKLEQYDLWVRNMDCTIEYKEITAGQNTKINIGVCPTSGDISIKATLPEGKGIIEWISFDRLRQANALLEFLVSSAYAAEGALAGAQVGVAQAESQVVCQGWEGNTRIVRIIKEGSRCFKETISPYQGHVDKRAEVPCDTRCPQSKR